MKKHYYSLFLAFLISLTAFKVSAQTSMANNTTLTQCGGSFLDPGGTGNYANNSNYTETICAGTAGQCVTIQFTAFNLESGYDFLKIYNGTGTGGTLLATLTGTVVPAQVTSTTGCLTLVFTSDNIFNYSGWDANLICTPCGSPPPPPAGPTVASDCSQAVNICTNASFAIDPNGVGAVNEIPSSGTVSNPSTNPGSANSGCLLSGERNSTWMIVTCQTAGTLQFSFGAGTGAGAQAGFYDWAMWPYNPSTTCNAIVNNTVAPVRCNWNGSSTGGTGCASPIPAGGSSTNYEPPLTVACGAQYLICFSNYSSASTTVALNFFGTTTVSCTPAVNPFTLNSPTICIGSSATLTASGSAGNTYSITSPSGQPAFSGTSVTVTPTVTTTYTVQAVGSCGTSTQTATVTVNGQPSGFSIANGNAGGGSDPTPAVQCVQNDLFDFTSVATTGTVTHSWNFGGGGASPATSTLANPTGISYSTCGTYTVTHTVTQGACTSTTTMTVNPTCPPTVTTTPTNATCGALGSATANPTGGTPGYTYSWAASGGSAATASNLNPGTYTVTVTDANGCTGTATATIASTGTVTSTFTSSANQCLTGNSFTFTNTGTSGGGVTSSWSFNPTAGAPASSSANNYTGTFTAAGTYTVTHTITQGSCTSTTTANVTVFPQPATPTMTNTPTTCGNNNGTITVTAPTGAGFQYSLNGGAYQTGVTFSSLATGTYTITVQNSNGCTATGTTTITATPPPSSVVLTPVSATCGASNGSFTIGAVTGGTAPYTYSMNASAFTSTTSYTGLATGTYTVVVKDANGCQYTQNVTVGSTSGPTALVVNSTPTACVGNTGTVTIGSTTGGTSPYTYNFNSLGFSATTSYSSLAAGTYPVIVKDNNGCTFSTTVTVGGSSGPTALAATTVNATCGGTNGSITLGAVTGGTSPYTYSFNGGAFGPTTSFTSLSAATYTITVKDANGCTFTINPVIGNSGAPTVSITAQTNVSCNGGNNGSVTVAGAGGTAPYTYNINGGAYTGTATFGTLSATSYTIGVKDANGCLNTVVATITQPTAVTGTISSQTNPGCFGGTNGSLTVAGSGGTGAFTYSLNGGAFQASGTFGSLASGSYAVTVKDANGCTTVVNVTLTQPTVLALSTSTTNAICTASNGTATVNPTGATPGYTYSWAPSGGTGATTVGVPAGTYTVTVTDSKGCVKTATATIGVTPGGTATMSGITHVACAGQSNGSLTVSMTGSATPGFTYAWSPNVGTTATVTGLPVGGYTVTVTDANGCVSSTNATLTQPPALTLNLSSSNVSCFGGSNGTITATAGGGTPAYTYLWSPGGAITPTVNNLPIGTYSCTLTDAHNCTATQSTTLIQPTALAINPVVSNPHCNQSDGSINVTGSGGAGGYTFSINGGAFSASTSFPGLPAGTYTITIKDGNLCTSSIPVSLVDQSGPSVTISSQTNVSCFGGNNGSATVSVTGGTAPLTYSWTPGGQTTPTATNLSQGIISVTVKDANNCTATASTTITEPPVLTTNISGTNPVCNGSCNGTASVGVLGGTSPYSYLWNNSQTTPSLTALCAGSYNVVVTDAKGCTSSKNIVLVNPAAITTTIAPTPVSCFGTCDGTATATVTNGTAPYAYSWTGTNPQTTPTAGNLCAGGYTVNVTDINGCTSTANTTITSPTQVVANIPVSTNVSCSSLCDGQAQATASGGTPGSGYTFNWMPVNLNGATVTGLCSNVYTVTATDANGCTAQATVNISQPNPLTITASGADISCFGLCDGTATATYSGGSGSYTFLWQPSLATTFNATALCAGTHTVTIKDANNCAATATVVLTEPNQLTAGITNIVPSNCLQNNGSACATVTGGTGPFTYSWNDPLTQTTLCMNNVVGSSYTVTVTDANNCTSQAVANINDIQAPNIVMNPGTNISCYGLCDGSSSATITGGAGGNIIQWSPGAQTTAAVNNLCAGLNTITVTDAAGCVSSATVNITQPTQLVTAINNVTHVSCFGGNDGSANVLMNGGTSPYTISWSPTGQIVTPAVNLTAATYTVTVTDNNNCQATSTVTINEPTQLVIQNPVLTDVLCFGQNNGQINITAAGGTPIYTYTWTPSVSTSNIASALVAGNYSVTVTDSKGCTANSNYTINEPTQLQITNLTIQQPHCNQNNGSATVVAVGGTPMYTINWNSNPSQNTLTASSLPTGTFICTITDAHGCQADTSALLFDPGPPAIDSITYIAPLCNGFNNGSSIVYPRGGTNPLTYHWNDPGSQVTQNASGLNSGTYQVVVTDAFGCVINASVTIPQPTPITLVTSQNMTACNGQILGVYAAAGGGTPAYTYTWSGAGTGLVGGGNHNITFVNTTSTSIVQSYSVNVTDANNCPVVSSQFNVTVLPRIVITPTNSTVCDGATGTLQAAAAGGDGAPYQFTWSTSASNSGTMSTIVVPGVINQSPQTFTVTVDDGCSTPEDTVVTLTVNPNPVAGILGVNLQGCTDLPVTFAGSSGGITGATFEWDFGDTSTTTIQNPSHIYTNSTSMNQSFTVQLIVTSPLGCKDTAVNVAYVTVYPKPNAEFFANPSTTSVLYPDVNFVDASQNAVSYVWDFGDPSSLANGSIVPNPSHTFENPGYYTVTLNITSANGCTDDVAHTIYIEPDYALYVPNAFSPNDDGKNETFFPKGIGIDENRYNLFIFDRWGELIFQSNKFDVGWDGKAKGGSDTVQEDVYIWKITVFDLKNNKHNLVGHVTVVR